MNKTTNLIVNIVSTIKDLKVQEEIIFFLR